MSNLEIKRLELDLLKIAAAKAELEFKIEERLVDIERMRNHIELQGKREKEVKKKLDSARGK
jgi:hypothetical protein